MAKGTRILDRMLRYFGPSPDGLSFPAPHHRECCCWNRVVCFRCQLADWERKEDIASLCELSPRKTVDISLALPAHSPALTCTHNLLRQGPWQWRQDESTSIPPPECLTCIISIPISSGFVSSSPLKSCQAARAIWLQFSRPRNQEAEFMRAFGASVHLEICMLPVLKPWQTCRAFPWCWQLISATASKPSHTSSPLWPPSSPQIRTRWACWDMFPGRILNFFHNDFGTGILGPSRREAERKQNLGCSGCGRDPKQSNLADLCSGVGERTKVRGG